MIAPDRPRRSALYLPASNARAIEKARGLPADVIILDLEDAVAPDAKDAAREAAVAAVRAGGFGPREVAIRINGLDTSWGAADLAAVSTSGADAVVIPKVSSPEDVLTVDGALSAAPAALQVWCMIETCAAMVRLEAIGAAAASTRMSLWIVGANDLGKEMGIRPTPGREALTGLLPLAVCAARAHGIVILDSVCNEFRDLDAFRAEAAQGRLYGFDGKSLIHPAQVEPANLMFGPEPAELHWAEKVIAAFALPENAGKGAIQVDGKMAELLHLDQARRLVARAAQIASLG
jgi:citrate lyase subunit beta/citryl-CoA lyase